MPNFKLGWLNFASLGLGLPTLYCVTTCPGDILGRFICFISERSPIEYNDTHLQEGCYFAHGRVLQSHRGPILPTRVNFNPSMDK